jgi:hypothetical protein
MSEQPTEPPIEHPIEPLPPLAAPPAVARATWLVFLVVLVGGSAICWGVADPRAALSYAGAALLAGIAFAVGAIGIRAAGQLAPFAAMMAAIGGYGITVLLFALVYAVADPDVVTFPAVAAGLLSAVAVWIFASIRALTASVNEEH